MTAIGIEINGRSEVTNQPVQEKTRRLMRASGLLYVVLLVFGMFSPLVLESLIVDGNATASAEKISDSLGLFGSSLVTWTLIVAVDIAASVTLYLLLEPVSKSLSMIVAAFRLVYSAVLGAFLLNLFDAFTLLNGTERVAGLDASDVQTMALSAIDRFEAGFLLALMFFGVHLIGLGILLGRSGYVPRVLSFVLVLAGAGYIVNSLASFFLTGHSDTTATILLMPALFGEVGLTAWLLLKGFRAQRGTPDIAE